MEVLRLGSSGPYVQMLQLALARAGQRIATDGIFGTRTRNAVMAFQRANGLTADGIVGPQTWRALEPYLVGFVNYTIRQGDTFFALARRYGTTVSAIRTANPSLVPERLTIGMSIVIPLGFSVVPVSIDYSAALCAFVVRGLAARYPFLTASSVGLSVMGKPLHLLRIGGGNKAAFYNASHHANEWITTPVLLKYMEDYAFAYANNGSIGGVSAASLYRNLTLYMVPLVNPDGVDLVTGALRSGEFYQDARILAEGYPSIPFPSGWKANIRGTDINLNYPAGWEEARRIKFAQGYTRPGPRDYVGSSPLSTPEAAALYDFTMAADFRLTLSYHTQGRVIYWKYLDLNPPGALQIAQRMSAASGYAVEETPYASGFAGYKDWFIYQFNRPGYTIEAGLGTNPLPISQFESIYRENIGILTVGMQAVAEM